MRFMDELRGSEGEACIVTDLRNGTHWPGVVSRLDEKDGKVYVKRDGGGMYAVGYSFVQLVADEK